MAVHVATVPRPISRPAQWPIYFARCFIEARLTVQFIFLLRFLAGRSLTGQGGRYLVNGRVFPAASVWEAVILAIYLHNGVADVVEDRLNRSTRPIASGLLPPSFAATVAIASAVLGVAGACVLGRTYVVLVLATLGLGYLYTGKPFALKRYSAGAGATVLLAGLLTFAAGAAVDGPLRLTTPLVVFAVAMSVWMGAVGALAKDLSDLHGDALAGRRTCVVVHGAESVRRKVTRNAMLIAVGLTVVSVAAVPQARLAALGLLVGAAALTVCSDRLLPDGLRHPRLPYRAFMATQYGVHLIVVFATFFALGSV